MMQLILLFLVLVVVGLQIADFVTKRAVLGLGGYEANKIMAWLMQRVGVPLALIFGKGGVSAAVLGLAMYVRDRPQPDQELVVIAFMFIIVGYWWVLQNNLRAYEEQKAKVRG